MQYDGQVLIENKIVMKDSENEDSCDKCENN